MLGTILTASIVYNIMDVASMKLNPIINQESVQTNAKYTVKLDDTLDNLEPKDSYTVNENDTLYSISKEYNISIAELKEINNLTEDSIYVEQKIKLNEQALLDEIGDNLILVNKNNALPTGYIPSGLINPNVHSLDKSNIKMTPKAAKALEALFLKAKENNIQLTAISGYRSYAYQNEIFTDKIKKYQSVAVANQFSARPGQSEHQTGLAMDISSPSVNFKLTQSLAQTREGKWLKNNAPEFGFIVRYPKGKENITGYHFEPWHIRYIGEDASREISDANITLEEYFW